MSLSAWRDSLAQLQVLGEALESVAAERGLDGSFVIRPQWPGIDWVQTGHEHDGESLGVFSSKVREVSALLGAPASVQGEAWISDKPDLVAKWKLQDALPEQLSHVLYGRTVTVTVRVLSPSGCKLDPRVEPMSATEGVLHPECKSVLRELEDSFEEVSS